MRATHKRCSRNPASPKTIPPMVMVTAVLVVQPSRRGRTWPRIAPAPSMRTERVGFTVYGPDQGGQSPDADTGADQNGDQNPTGVGGQVCNDPVEHIAEYANEGETECEKNPNRGRTQNAERARDTTTRGANLNQVARGSTEQETARQAMRARRPRSWRARRPRRPGGGGRTVTHALSGRCNRFGGKKDTFLCPSCRMSHVWSK